jgi:hypothetical protein
MLSTEISAKADSVTSINNKKGYLIETTSRLFPMGALHLRLRPSPAHGAAAVLLKESLQPALD